MGAIRSEKIQLAVMMLVFFGLLAVVVPLVSSQLIPKDAVHGFKVPGRALIDFDGAGAYRLYYEQFIDDTQSVQQREKKALPRLKISIFKHGTDKSQSLALIPVEGKYLYRMGRRNGISLFSFTVTEPGKYLIEAYYQEKDTDKPIMRLAIGQGTADSGLIRKVILILIAVIGTAGIVTMLFCVVKLVRQT